MTTNKDIKNNEEIKKEEKGYVLEKNLDPVDLIIKNDEKLKELLSKKFSELTAEEKKKLPTAKVRIVNRTNKFIGKTQRYVRIIFFEGIYFERMLDSASGEEALLKLKYPELFVKPKEKKDIAFIDVPVRLYSYLKEDGSYTYQFSAELCQNVLMRGASRTTSSGKQYYNYFNGMQLEVLMSNDTQYRFVLLDSPLRSDDELEEFEE